MKTGKQDKMTISLCLITWNEIQGCKHDIPLLDKNQFEEIYCIDGGSTDGTIEYLMNSGINVYNQSSKGLNQAYIDGIIRSTCDAVVFFHPKGTVTLSDVYEFRNYFDKGYEFVVASRMMRGGRNEEEDRIFRPRKWFVLILGLAAKICFKKEGNTIWDVLHGFKGITVKAFSKMSISNEFTPSIDIEMVCRAYKKQIKRIEFPTKESRREGGNTHFRAYETGKKLLKYFWWEVFRKG